VKSPLAFGVMAVLMAMGAQPAYACATLTPKGEAQKAKREQSFLRAETDRIVVGTWRVTEDRNSDDGSTLGVIDLVNGKSAEKYRLRLPGVINCGFPFYFLKDGDRGRFYLKRGDAPESGDADDGFIDNFRFVHFVPMRASR